MAVMGAPQAGGSTGMKVALVVFVVLTVASLTGTIILYTYQADLQAQADSAGTQRAQAQQQQREASQKLQDFAQALTGEPTDEIPKIQQAIRSAMQPAVSDTELKDARIAADAPLLGAFEALYAQYTAARQAQQQAEATLKEHQDQQAEREAGVKDAQKAYTDRIEQLQKEYAALEQQGVQNQQAWDQQVAQLREQLDAAGEAASQQLRAERTQREALERKLAESQQRTEALVSELASFRPRADLTSVLQIADGQVVRAVPLEGIAYISLGTRDGVRRGLTFSAYSRTGGIPADGKGKATLEVVEPFETTSECKITTSEPGQPVVSGDVVANPVFERGRQYSYLVAGDFDLNFDGRAEDRGGEQVKKLIREAGGRIVSGLDTSTDFVVLGAAPPLAVTEEAGNGAAAAPTAEDQERAARRQAERDTFDAIVREAKALSIPVLTRTQFLHFMGIGVPRNAPGDQPVQ